ncbi:FCD domain-containing protein [Rhodococcus hoagii]|nr:FCD domain-containing protein [Prescottella equi]
MSGRLRPGAFVRLDETATELGVSGHPGAGGVVRSGERGWSESVPNRGYVVSPLDRDDVYDIFWLQGRITVELRCVPPVRRRTPTTWRGSPISTRFSTTRSGATDAERIAEAEYEFHRELCRIAGGPSLPGSWPARPGTTPHQLYAADPEWGALAVRAHADLIAAIAARDGAAVVRHTRIQFDDAADRLVAHLERSGIWQ